MKSIVSWVLRSDNEELSQAFKVKGIMVLNEVNRIPRARILLLDGAVSQQNFALSNQDFFKPGRTMEISLGYESDVQLVFSGLIVRHGLKIDDNSGSFLEIECKHAAVKLTRTKHNRYFYDQSDKEALETLLGDTDILFDINGLDGFVNEQLVQYECTAWDFMLSRIDNNGGLLFFDPKTLHISPPTLDGEPVLQCQYGSNVIGFEAMMDCESQVEQVETKSWSSAEQEMLVVRGTPGFDNTAGNISTDELAAVMNDGPFYLQHTANLPDDELTSWANAWATKNALAKVQGHVRLPGTADVFPGKLIQLSGFGDRFSGKVFVTGVRHEVSNGSWTTDLRFGLPADEYLRPPDMNALPAAAMLPAVSGVQLGTVTQLESDPDGEFRIKVRIPTISEEEDGIWAKLVKGYAGDTYGICFLPEIGDEVAVCFLNDDPRKPLVLGALHSSAKPSPIQATDDNHEKGMVSRSNLRIMWDDEKKVIRIDTPKGNEIVLDEQEEKVSLKDANDNRIVLDANGILIESAKGIRLKANEDIQLEGLNIGIKAKAGFAAEGASGAEVKTDAIAIVKGSLVQIN